MSIINLLKSFYNGVRKFAATYVAILGRVIVMPSIWLSLIAMAVTVGIPFAIASLMAATCVGTIVAIIVDNYFNGRPVFQFA